MSNVRFNPTHKDVLDSFLLDSTKVRPGKMFGYPAYSNIQVKTKNLKIKGGG